MMMQMCKKREDGYEVAGLEQPTEISDEIEAVAAFVDQFVIREHVGWWW